MHTILLISRDEGLKEQLEALLEQLEWRLTWLKLLPMPAEAANVLLLGDDFWTSASADQLSDLRKQLPDAQVVLLAPLSRRQEMQRLLRIYADDYLILPLDKEEVVSVLQKCEEIANQGKSLEGKKLENCNNAGNAVMQGMMKDLTKGLMDAIR